MSDKETIQITSETVDQLKFNDDGLIPAIIQDDASKDVLMMAYMNVDSLRETLKGGKTCFWSRSRQEYWVKGMTSGHFQFVKNIAYDCDCDTLLIRVKQEGFPCHTMKETCFYREIKTTVKG